jgi:hypothetical protein
MAGAGVIALATVALSAQGAAPEGIPAAVLRGVDYCEAVARAELTDAPPILTGPAGFSEQRERYGAMRWVYGTPENGVVVTPGLMCSVFARETAGVAEAMTAWVASQPEFQPDNEAGTRHFATVEGGWLTVAWSVQSGADLGTTPLVWVTVFSTKESG